MSDPARPVVTPLNKPVASGGGGTQPPDMETRVARLEDIADEIRTDLKGIRTDLAELKGRVSQLPSTVQMLGFVLAVLALAGLGRWLGPAAPGTPAPIVIQVPASAAPSVAAPSASTTLPPLPPGFRVVPAP